MKICVENALAARTYARFLEREVYAFLSTLDKRGERVRGDSCGPAFFVCGRAAEAGEQAATDRPQSNAGERHRGKGRRLFFLFLGEEHKDLFLKRDEQNRILRSWGVKGGRRYWTAAMEKFLAASFVGARRAPSLRRVDTLAACGRRIQLIQLIYLRYLCGDAE